MVPYSERLQVNRAPGFEQLMEMRKHPGPPVAFAHHAAGLL